MISLTEKIKQKAFEIGFHKIGIAPRRYAHARARTSQRMACGRFSRRNEMDGARAGKTHESESDFSRSKINYCRCAKLFHAASNTKSMPTKGKVSRYAWGDDYHEVMQGKLRELLSWIKSEIPEAEGKICCDIQPVMDKAWAVRAGLAGLANIQI